LKAPRFAYVRPGTVAETLEVLSAHGDESRLLAGGQSLIPMLNMRVASPRVLVDINSVAGLRGISVVSDRIRIGALTRHYEIEQSKEIAEYLPLLALAIRHVAHPAIRNRGTFGGSCALADPAAELPACALALDAQFIVANPVGERRVAAADFFCGVYSTALGANEILVAAEFPRTPKGHISVFDELVRRHGDYAMVGVAAQGSTIDHQFSNLRIVLFGVGDRPLRAANLEKAISGKTMNPHIVQEAIANLDDDVEPRGDLHCSAGAKLHLARVLVRRAIGNMGGLSGLME
jgi:carbon-monoxide dehydrogenase medium subunit